jgi:hypothetical protein
MAPVPGDEVACGEWIGMNIRDYSNHTGRLACTGRQAGYGKTHQHEQDHASRMLKANTKGHVV